MPVKYLERGLELQGDVTFEEWQAIIVSLFQMEKSRQWWIGDAVIYGEGAYSEMFSQALDDTLIPYRTIQAYARVSSRVSMATRVAELSWSHHRVVSSFIDEDQSYWLRRAREEGWSVAALSREIKGEDVIVDKAVITEEIFGLLCEDCKSRLEAYVR